MLAKALSQKIDQLSMTRQLGIVLFGTILLTLSAKIQVPMFWVKPCLQPLALLLLAGFLGPRLATLTVAAYMVEGALGLPVFQSTPEKGIGLPYMMGPTGGFILGFLAVTWVYGTLVQKWRSSFVKLVGAGMLAYIPLYILGVSWLSQFIGWHSAFINGCLVFMPTALLKTILSASLLRLKK